MSNLIKFKNGDKLTSEDVYDANFENTLQEALSILLADGAGAHNSHYRGKYLGSAPTEKQYAAIADGTFKDLYIGDYWTINNVNYRIAAFDYFLNIGDTATTAHHAVMVPDTYLYSAQMNASATTAGGYVGSEMYTTNLEQAKTLIKNAFSGHILKHQILLTNAVESGKASGWAWYDAEVDLMSEQMVFGRNILSPTMDCIEYAQLPLFQYKLESVRVRGGGWLRDILSASQFEGFSYRGYVTYFAASSSYGVRPYFCIY